MVASEARDNLTELRRGVLEYCVLAVLRRKESYGFEIVHVLSEAGGLVTSEGTIYPLLARLRREGLVSTKWQESTAGPPRRYYRLSEDGARALGEFERGWSHFSRAVDELLLGAGNGRNAGGD